MPSLALLVFTRNDGEGAISLFRENADLFDEFVLIDSSDPAEFDRLAAKLPPGVTTVRRVLPIGYVDILRPYGVSAVRSDRVLMLDTDESISPALRLALPALNEKDAYILARREQSLGAFTYHLRLFRRNSVSWGAESWGFPIVRGLVGTLPRSQSIFHADEYASYLDPMGRGGRVLLLESYERPFTSDYLERMVSPIPLPAGWSRTGYLPDVAVRAALWMDFVRRLLRTGSYRLSRFTLAYDRARWAYSRSLDPIVRERRLQIHREMREAGGMTKYLGLDDSEYVDRLTASFGWDHDWRWVFETLIRYRHERGRPLESFARL
jgi:hypothetical protein